MAGVLWKDKDASVAGVEWGRRKNSPRWCLDSRTWWVIQVLLSAMEALLLLLLLSRGVTRYNLSGSCVKNEVGRWPRVEAEKAVSAVLYCIRPGKRWWRWRWGDSGGDYGALG